MWALLWVLPPVFLWWAVLLTIKRARRAAEPMEEDKPLTIEERLARAHDDEELEFLKGTLRQR